MSAARKKPASNPGKSMKPASPAKPGRDFTGLVNDVHQALARFLQAKRDELTEGQNETQ